MSEIKHIAFIPDGNRRWARAQKLPTLEGHRRGYNKLKDVGKWCLDRGIEYCSFWGFSTENWKRSEEEVSYLMDLMVTALTKEVDFYNKEDIRLRVIGRREGLSERVLKAIESAEEKTKQNKKGQLNICFNYGGRPELLDGIKKLLEDGVAPGELTEEMIGGSLWTAGIPDPDIIVRTSGEQRLSGFMPWSGVYSELFFIKKHWPAFEESDLDAILEEFENRNRRFGGN